ncbi:DUF805 domain-containing protein [Erythrobacter gaetbuli]|uniref:DUF805 domain-containing protein n=1 Tax=Qipengyuania gaetbuli TaxID=266952 RepID=A0A844XXB4_9SPHN|nr:DUF805 domain-containing protein [Qipengyuania gaetbuli]MXO49989.1 DUF805 domain-containing protein [Qipengyuania gaetbuli]
MEYMLLPYARFFEFGGRSTRMEYWMFTLFFCVVMLVILIAGGAFDSFLFGQAYVEPDLESAGLGLLVFGLFLLVSLIPMLALTIRRFHDVGLSGWLYLGLALLSLVPFVGWLASIGIFVITVLPSDRSDNQWGDNPHGLGLDHRYGLREEYRAGKGVRYR